MISDYDLRLAQQNLHLLDPAQKARVLALLQERERLATDTAAKEHFLDFVRQVWPDFIAGPHHGIMAKAFDRVARGELKRLIINMAPRHTKSQFASWLLPAWFIGLFPKRQIIQVSNTVDLAGGFGRQVRNMVDGIGDDVDADGKTPYQRLFPKVRLARDSTAAADWHTSQGGRYFAVGVNGKVTGKGADIAIVDDPHSEQEAKQAETRPEIFDDVYEWYTSGIRQRLQPGGAIIIVMTRWSHRDLVGKLLTKMEQDIKAGLQPGEYDDWEVIELPAILDEDLPTERPMWPGYWSLAELRATRNALPPAKWQAQYQQKPSSRAGAIIKSESWRRWGEDTPEDIALGRSSCPGQQHRAAWNYNEPPACEFIIMSLDTAITSTDRADYTAFTTWGIFNVEDPKTGQPLNHAILLNAFKERLTFPELKRKLKQLYNEDQPDVLLIENKGSGMSLIQELRAMNIPVEAANASRGSKKQPNDKVARANLVTDIFDSGFVWAPQTRYADEVILECQQFPNGEHDDYVDSTVHAMLRFRAGGLISTVHDVPDEEDTVSSYRRKRYY